VPLRVVLDHRFAHRLLSVLFFRPHYDKALHVEGTMQGFAMSFDYDT
jgi:hypothetical protein